MVCRRFLVSLKKVWLDHKRSLLMVRDILMYMDRTYVKQNQKKPVYEMGLAIFCQYCTRSPRYFVLNPDLFGRVGVMGMFKMVCVSCRWI